MEVLSYHKNLFCWRYENQALTFQTDWKFEAILAKATKKLRPDQKFTRAFEEGGKEVHSHKHTATNTPPRERSHSSVTYYNHQNDYNNNNNCRDFSSQVLKVSSITPNTPLFFSSGADYNGPLVDISSAEPQGEGKGASQTPPGHERQEEPTSTATHAVPASQPSQAVKLASGEDSPASEDSFQIVEKEGTGDKEEGVPDQKEGTAGKKETAAAESQQNPAVATAQANEGEGERGAPEEKTTGDIPAANDEAGEPEKKKSLFALIGDTVGAMLKDKGDQADQGPAEGNDSGADKRKDSSGDAGAAGTAAAAEEENAEKGNCCIFNNVPPPARLLTLPACPPASL